MTIKRALIAVPVMIVGWLSVLVGVGLLSDAAPASVVILPRADFVANLPTEVALLSQTRFSVTLAADTPGFARSLYGQGAWLVLPAGLPGCLPYPKTRASQN